MVERLSPGDALRTAIALVELDPRAEDYEASVDALIEGVDAVALVPPLVQVFQELAERVDPETTQKALSRLRRLSFELDG